MTTHHIIETTQDPDKLVDPPPLPQLEELEEALDLHGKALAHARLALGRAIHVGHMPVVMQGPRQYPRDVKPEDVLPEPHVSRWRQSLRFLPLCIAVTAGGLAVVLLGLAWWSRGGGG